MLDDAWSHQPGQLQSHYHHIICSLIMRFMAFASEHEHAVLQEEVLQTPAGAAFKQSNRWNIVLHFAMRDATASVVRILLAHGPRQYLTAASNRHSPTCWRCGHGRSHLQPLQSTSAKGTYCSCLWLKVLI